MPGEDLYPALMAINEEISLLAVFQVEKSGPEHKIIPPGSGTFKTIRV